MMGDLGDYWREHREYLRSNGISRSRARRRAVEVRFGKKHEALGFRQCSQWHWQAKIGADLLDYWPSKSKWRFRGETKTGTWNELVKLIKETAPQ